MVRFIHGKGKQTKPKGKGDMNFKLKGLYKSKQLKSMYSIVNLETLEWNTNGKYWLTSLDDKYDTDFFISSCSGTRCFGQIKMSK